MNEVGYIENYFKKIQNNLKQNYKPIVVIILVILSVASLTQFYFYNKNNEILKNSIEFNLAKSSNSQNNFKVIIDKLSQEKGFYGVLATLEKINIKLKEGDIITVNEEYLRLLEQSKLSKLYKGAIATHGAYSFLNIINKNNEIEITTLINNFLSYIDPSLLSYEGFKLEILYLLSVIKQDNNKDILVNDEALKLYKQIQENDKISSSLKERVKQIHEYQKYK